MESRWTFSWQETLRYRAFRALEPGHLPITIASWENNQSCHGKQWTTCQTGLRVEQESTAKEGRLKDIDFHGGISIHGTRWWHCCTWCPTSCLNSFVWLKPCWMLENIGAVYSTAVQRSTVVIVNQFVTQCSQESHQWLLWDSVFRLSGMLWLR